jgi:flavin-dependent dehydrogenase
MFGRDDSEYEVVVIGGGPSGAATASQLAAAGRRVLVLERTRYQESRIGETLPPRARVPLARLGLIERMEGSGHLPSPAMVSVWGGGAPQWNDFITNPYGSGWHIDRGRFDRMLADECRARGAVVREGVKVRHCAHSPGGWKVSLHTAARAPQEHVSCRFLVDATGRGTRKIHLSGLPTVYDRLVGIAALYDDCSARAQDDSTLVESVAQGWWYSARLPDERRIAVFMTDSDLVYGGRGGLKAFLQRQLRDAQYTTERVRPVAEAKSTCVWPAITSMHPSVGGPDWLLTGDAASAWDPLSGQGICKALESGIDAAQAIERTLQGDGGAIREYARTVHAQFDDYLESRARYYTAEQRWRDFPFWSRRHAPIDRARRAHTPRTEQPATAPIV